MNEGREDPWNVKNEISRETVTYGNIRRSMKRGRKKKKNDILLRLVEFSTILSILVLSF